MILYILLPKHLRLAPEKTLIISFACAKVKKTQGSPQVNSTAGA
jgi:hypothetical protein